MKKELQKFNADAVIDEIGGTGETARLFHGLLSDSCVSQWRHRGFPDVVQLYLLQVRRKAFKDEFLCKT